MTTRSCLWPECPARVPASMWGCKTHWFKLPRAIRAAIWAAYRPGQERDLAKVSPEYTAAARAAQEWIKNEGAIAK